MNKSVLQKRKLRLAVFDLDGTLTTVRSPFLYVSDALGRGNKAREIGRQYAEGGISYEEWGRGIVALWTGTHSETIQAIASHIPFRKGAIEFVCVLQQQGVFVSLISVAFEQHVRFRAKILNINHYECNELLESNGIITGEYNHRVNHSNKSEFVKAIQKRLGIHSSETLAAGDTTSDISMFKEASISIAIDPECSKVSESATLTLINEDWQKGLDLLEVYFDFN